MTVVTVIDYGMGNLHSVRSSLETIGADVVMAATPDAVLDAERILLPGVGAFGECLTNLRASGMVDALREQVLERGRPMLGICVGMQALAAFGEEMGRHEGLGWIPGTVRKLDVAAQRLRIPHVGWNEVQILKPHPVLKDVKPQSTFYFVHSYAFYADDADAVIATCDYGGPFTSVIARDNIVATQFHPEKSQNNGLQVLERFLDWNP